METQLLSIQRWEGTTGFTLSSWLHDDVNNNRLRPGGHSKPRAGCGSPLCGSAHRASWSTKLSEGNIWKTCGSWTSTWEMEPVFIMFLTNIWGEGEEVVSAATEKCRRERRPFDFLMSSAELCLELDKMRSCIVAHAVEKVAQRNISQIWTTWLFASGQNKHTDCRKYIVQRVLCNMGFHCLSPIGFPRAEKTSYCGSAAAATDNEGP